MQNKATNAQSIVIYRDVETEDMFCSRDKVRECSNLIKTVRISVLKVQLACLSNIFIIAVTNSN